MAKTTKDTNQQRSRDVFRSVLPGNTSRIHWAKDGEYITQVTAIGPLGLEYVDRVDDPREPGPKNINPKGN